MQVVVTRVTKAEGSRILHLQHPQPRYNNIEVFQYCVVIGGSQKNRRKNGFTTVEIHNYLILVKYLSSRTCILGSVGPWSLVKTGIQCIYIHENFGGLSQQKKSTIPLSGGVPLTSVLLYNEFTNQNCK